MMKRLLVFIFSLILTGNVWAADNTVIVTPGVGLTLRSRDVGAGVQSLQQILGDTSGNALATAPGVSNAVFALPIQGVTGGIAVPISGAITITSGTTTVTQATGTNLHAVLDATSTTAVTQATGTNLHSVIDSGTITTVSTVTNLSQMNGVALLMGNGVTGTGSQRVTIASDNTAFAVNSTLTAETTKVIGTVRNLGNGGAITDFAGQNATVPANSWLVGCEFTTSPTTITTGNASPLSCANDNSLRVTIVAGAGSGGTAIADGATFTEATTSFTPIGGEYVSGGGANCTTGKGCTLQMTIDRAAYTNSYKWAGGVIGAMANYGTSPGAVLVPGVNAFVTNTNANGQATAANSSPVVLPTAQVSIGTAGTASTNVVTIQGIAAMTKLLVTPDSVALPANQSVNVAQVAGATTPVGSGVMATAMRIAIATDSPGVITLGSAVKASSVPFVPASDLSDPCQNSNILKSSVAINITTATTTSLVAISGSTAIYACGISMTISEVITTPNTIQFEYGTGATCGTGTTVLTGKYGDGGVTAGIPIVVNASNGGTIFSTPAAQRLCALTAIGATASFHGVLTYVQQ